nr:MAG TPA: hypothetical protein [Caudoviricetes sp.]
MKFHKYENTHQRPSLYSRAMVFSFPMKMKKW